MYSKSTWCLTSTETVRLIRDGEKGGVREGSGEVGWGIEWGKRERLSPAMSSLLGGSVKLVCTSECPL